MGFCVCVCGGTLLNDVEAKGIGTTVGGLGRIGMVW